MRDLLDTSTIAARLGVAVPTVARWCRDGRFPNAFRVGRSWAIPATDLDGFERPRVGRPKPQDEPGACCEHDARP